MEPLSETFEQSWSPGHGSELPLAVTAESYLQVNGERPCYLLMLGRE